MVKRAMVFIYIKPGEFPKTRAQLAKISGRSFVTTMKNPVFYADEDASIVCKSAVECQAIAGKARRAVAFASAGRS